MIYRLEFPDNCADKEIIDAVNELSEGIVYSENDNVCLQIGKCKYTLLFDPVVLRKFAKRYKKRNRLMFLDIRLSGHKAKNKPQKDFKLARLPKMTPETLSECSCPPEQLDRIDKDK